MLICAYHNEELYACKYKRKLYRHYFCERFGRKAMNEKSYLSGGVCSHTQTPTVENFGEYKIYGAHKIMGRGFTCPIILFYALRAGATSSPPSQRVPLRAVRGAQHPLHFRSRLVGNFAVFVGGNRC